jgi:hypothetical protein
MTPPNITLNYSKSNSSDEDEDRADYIVHQSSGNGDESDLDIDPPESDSGSRRVLKVTPPPESDKSLPSINPTISQDRTHNRETEQAKALSHLARKPFGANVSRRVCLLSKTYELTKAHFRLHPDRETSPPLKFRKSLSLRSTLLFRFQTSLFPCPCP